MKSFFTSFLLLPCAALAADTNALPPLAPPYGKMPTTIWEQFGTAMLTVGFILLAGAVIALRLLLKPKPQTISPPETVAREALAKLQRQPEDGRLLSEVSQILRRYTGTVFGFSGGEMTTAEFCAQLARNEKIGAELAQTISRLLRECDERKFARSSAFTRPDPPEGGTPNPLPPLNAAARALELVALAQRSAPVPGAVISKTPTIATKQQSHNSPDVAASGDGRAP